MFKWLGLRKNRGKAMAFVDYEYWFYSYKSLYHIKPDLVKWRDDLEKKYSISDIMVFADFSPSEIGDEKIRLRSITNTIIETGNTYQGRTKDMTDFIMLDYIYQCASTKRDIDNYIIFTGDGHFHSVVKYLTHKMHKNVIVYGVKDSFNKQLQSAASEAVVLPADMELFLDYYKMIIDNMYYVSNKSDIYPTFMGTIEAVSKFNNVPADQIKAALVRMIDQGYIYQKDYHIARGKRIKVLAANWKLLIKDGLWRS